MSPQTHKVSKLVDWKREQSETTRQKLEAALDRFKSGKLINLPRAHKLTRIALAEEAQVSADTPFARYRPGHSMAGQYRFPEVVSCFQTLRKKLARKPSDTSSKKLVKELKTTIIDLERRLKTNRSVVNAQDIRIRELELKNQDVEGRLSRAIEERDGALKKLKNSR